MTFVRALKRFMHELLVWLGGRLAYLWLALAVLLIASVFAFTAPLGEQRMRVVGWILELCGLFTVAWDIAKTREHFRLPSFVETASMWWSQRPRFRLEATSVTVQIKGVAAVATAGGLSAAIGVAKPTLEQRLTALESEWAAIKLRVSGAEGRLRQEIEARKEQVEQETASRKKEVERLAQTIKEAHTGGLYLSVVGLVWLSAGLTLSTVPGEIIGLLR